jgi:hypothetical protein
MQLLYCAQHCTAPCRFSRYPAILARSVDALEAQLSGLAELLGADIQRAARLAFKVPALAAATNEELQEHMALLERVRLLDTTSLTSALVCHYSCAWRHATAAGAHGAAKAGDTGCVV